SVSRKGSPPAAPTTEGSRNGPPASSPGHGTRTGSLPPPGRPLRSVLEQDAAGVEFVADAVGFGPVLAAAGLGAAGDEVVDLGIVVAGLASQPGLGVLL